MPPSTAYCPPVQKLASSEARKTAIEQAPEVEEACNKMSPLNRMGTVEEVAAMAVFLASDEASFCTGGQYAVEGGTISQHPKM